MTYAEWQAMHHAPEWVMTQLMQDRDGRLSCIANHYTSREEALAAADWARTLQPVDLEPPYAAIVEINVYRLH